MAGLNRELWPSDDKQYGGHGREDGSGLGCGCGAGCGFADGSGDGAGLESPCTAGLSDGCGLAFGAAPGQGEAEEEENGCGDGYASGAGIKRISGMEVQMLDETLVIITGERGNAVRGLVVRDDLSLRPYWIVSRDGECAFGRTRGQALANLEELLEELQMCAELKIQPETRYPKNDRTICIHRG